MGEVWIFLLFWCLMALNVVSRVAPRVICYIFDWTLFNLWDFAPWDWSKWRCCSLLLLVTQQVLLDSLPCSGKSLFVLLFFFLAILSIPIKFSVRLQDSFILTTRSCVWRVNLAWHLRLSIWLRVATWLICNSTRGRDSRSCALRYSTSKWFSLKL